MEVLRFEVALSCSCKEHRMHAGDHPLYFDDDEDAALAFARLLREPARWAVHLRGRHVVNVFVNGVPLRGTG